VSRGNGVKTSTAELQGKGMSRPFYWVHADGGRKVADPIISLSLRGVGSVSREHSYSSAPAENFQDVFSTLISCNA